MATASEGGKKVYQRFDYQKRKLLETYISKRVAVKTIAEAIGVSRASVYTELKKGLEEGETDRHCYSADLAQRRVEEVTIRKMRGE